MKRVLAVDPGEKCGWARAEVDSQGNWHNMRHGISPWREFAIRWYRTQLTEDEPYEVLIYERFALYRSHALQLVGSDMQTAQCIGALRLVGWLSGTRLVSQGATIKASATRSAPRWLTDYIATFPRTHDEAHDADALLHLWHWTFKHHDVIPRMHRGKDA